MMAAAELFAECGLDATKMEDIASATGVPKATLYYYFEGKEEILTHLFGELLDAVARAVTTAAEGSGSAADRLRGVIVAHLKVFEAFPAASRATHSDLGRAARIPVIAERIESAFLGPVRKLLKEGSADGSLRPVKHPRLIATAILGSITTVGINALTLGKTRAAESVADEVVNFVLQGVGA